ncbi:MAG: DUF4493 domain-containing protein [Mucinivorans sp.]
MKKIFLILAMTALLASCAQDKTAGGGSENQGKGKVSIGIQPGDVIVVTTDKAQAKKAAAASSMAASNGKVDVNGFGVNFTTSKGEAVASYASYAELPGELELKAGDYMISAKNDGVTVGGAWDKPLYSGTSPFSIKVDQKTQVNVLCELRSTGVTLAYDATTLAALDNISVTLSVTGTVLDDTPANARRTAWFVVPGAVDGNKIVVKINAINKATGEGVAFEQPITEPKAKELRRMTIKVLTSGSSSVVVNIDETVVSKDVTVSVPDADDIIDNNGDNGSWDEDGQKPDPDPKPQPTVPTVVGKSLEGAAFNIDQVVIVDRTLPTNILDVEIASTATAGLTNLFLRIESPSLTEMLASQYGMVGEVDLANPPFGESAPGWVALFTDPMTGIIDPNVPIAGKTLHTFSVGGLMSLLGIIDTAGGIEHKFHLRVVDANGTTAKTLTLMLQY